MSEITLADVLSIIDELIMEYESMPVGEGVLQVNPHINSEKIDTCRELKQRIITKWKKEEEEAGR